MIVEIAAILAVLVGGVTLMRAVGFTGWALVPVSFLAGTGVYLLVGLVQVALPISTSPVITMVATAVIPAVVWAAMLARGKDVSLSPRYAAVSAVGAVAAVVIFRFANLLVWHVDSLVYLEMGALLAWGHFETDPSNYLLTARMLGIPLIHAPASLTHDYYLRSAVPLLAVATLALLLWLFREGTRGALSRRSTLIIAALAVGLLVTSNRVIYHSFYLNGHLMAGAFVLMIAGTAWLMATRPALRVAPLMTIQLLAIPALVITRPEGAVLVALALLPMALHGAIPVRARSAALATLGASMVLWFGYVHLSLAGAGVESEWSTRGMIGIGALMGVAALVVRAVPLVRNGLSHRRSRIALGAVEVLLWLALAAFTARDVGLLARSARSTLLNQVQGSWGVTMVGLAGLVLLAIVLLRNRDLTMLRFPITTFIPLVFLLAYLRDAAYRIGPTDSLNRMWIQVVPLAVFYVIAAVTLAKDTEVEPEERQGTTAAPLTR